MKNPFARLFRWKTTPENKEVVPLKISFVIPEDKTKEFIRLLDMNSRRPSRITKYDLWKFVEDILPDTKEGQWHYWFDSATKVLIREGDAEDWGDEDVDEDTERLQ